MENEYVILIHNLDAGSNGLLGEFNAEKNYDIKQDVKNQLKITNKLITDYKQDEITAVATVGSYSFDFVVYVQLGEQNKKRLTLFFKEKAKILQEDKEFLTRIESVVVDVSQNNLEVIKKEFKMYTADESVGIDMANANLTGLKSFKDGVVAHSKFLQKELISLDKAYVLKMLSLIKTSGSVGNDFILQFKNLILAKKLNKSKDNYWRTLKNILDKLVIQNEPIFNEKLKEKIKELQVGYIHLTKNIKEPVVANAPAKKKKEEKKEGGKGGKPKDKSKEKGTKEKRQAKPKPNDKGNGNQKQQSQGVIKSEPKYSRAKRLKSTSYSFGLEMTHIFNTEPKTLRGQREKQKEELRKQQKGAKQDLGRDL